MAKQRRHKPFTYLTTAIVSCLGMVASSRASAQPPESAGEQPATEASAPAESAPPPAPMALPPSAPPPSAPPPSLILDGEVPKGPIAPAFPPALPSVDYGARMRLGIKMQNAGAPDKMNDIGEQIDADVLVSGQIHRYFRWMTSLTLAYSGNAGQSKSVNVQPLDIFAHIPFLPEFNLMIGNHLVMADRFAPGGPWSADEYVFAGFFPLVGPPALPKAGPVGRDVGTSVWGALFGGHAKYYLGVFNLNDPTSTPLYSGRVQVSLLGREPAFNQRATYYGTKDLISAGVGAQYQKDGSTRSDTSTDPPTVLTDNYKYLTGDLTVEKSITDVGTLSFIGTFAKFWGQYQPWKQAYLVSLGYMYPKVIGIGKPRLGVRYQGAKSPADGAKTSSVIDVQLSYNVHAWYARAMLGYRRGDTWLVATGASQESNMLYLALQLWDP